MNNPSGEKVLITGGTGFFGSHLIERLISLNYNVIVLKRTNSDLWRIQHLLPSITIINIDVTTIQRVFDEHSPIDVCIHTATVYSSKKSLIRDIITTNLSFPLDLLMSSVAYTCPVFINIDSFYTLFHKQYQYLNEYSTAKAHFKEWGDLYDSREGIKFINARLFHLYGPKDNSIKFVSYIIKWLMNNQDLIKLTSGIQKRDFIYMDDAVDALILIIENMKTINHRQIDIGTGNSVSIRSFVELAHNLTGSTSVLKFGALPTRQGEVMDITANTKIITELGWKQNISLTDGLKSLINQ